MNSLEHSLPLLLGAAWLLPLLSFTIIVFLGPKLGPHGKYAAYVATGAILTAFVLSSVALFSWLGTHGFDGKKSLAQGTPHATASADPDHVADPHAEGAGGHHDEVAFVRPITGNWYDLGVINEKLRLSIGYHIDALTVVMFAMVTLIASCIHFYAMGYMHDELHTITDHEVILEPNPYGDHHEEGHDAQDRPRRSRTRTARTSTTRTGTTIMATVMAGTATAIILTSFVPAAFIASSNTCRCFASACWGWCTPATWRWSSCSGNSSAFARSF
ncbi:MAG: hypothetical protein QM811_07405 [Pirellulales bacterium]